MTEKIPKKLAVITGANGGIGQEIAIGLARAGMRIIMTARNPSKGRAAVERVQRESGNPEIALLLADFARLHEVRRLAAEIHQREPRVNVLVNNAGLALGRREETEDGHEAVLQINHLAPFLLTQLLLPTLTGGHEARVINIASDAHWLAPRRPLEDIQAEKRFSTWRVYGRSKLYNILFTKELATRLSREEGSRAVAYSAHPGVVASGFGGDGDLGPINALGYKLGRVVMLSPAQGARTPIMLATADPVPGHTGDYFWRGRRRTPSKLGRDRALAKELWDISEALVGLREEPS